MATRPVRRRVGLVGSLVAASVLIALPSDVLAFSWASDSPITHSGAGYAYPGGLAVSSTTTAHAVYEQQVLGSFVVSYRRTTNSGASWSTPILLSRLGVNEAGAPAVDAAGAGVDAVWLEGDSILAGLDSAVIYRRSIDSGATWQDAVQLNPLFESAGFPRVAHQGATVVVTWTNELNGRVYLRRSTDGGATFLPRVQVATTTNKRTNSTLYEAFPTVAFGSGVIYLGYYSANHRLALRRSTNGGSAWTTAATISTSAATRWSPSIAAAGSTVVVGYARETSSDDWTVISRSTNKGSSWAAPVSLSPASSYRSFQPVITYRAGAFRAIYERCASNACGTSDLFYRSSPSGTSWSAALKASVRKRAYDSPADVDVATKVLILYVDASSSANDVYVRRGG